MRKVIVGILVVLALAVVLREVRPQPYSKDWNMSRFSSLPVLEGGRIQPIDTVARNTLLGIRKNTSVTNPDTGSRIPPGEWAAIMLFNPKLAPRIEAFRIDFNELQGSLNLPVGSKKFFSLEELAPQLDTLQALAQNAESVDGELRTPVQRSVLQLQRGLSFFLGLHFSVANPRVPEISLLATRFQELVPAALTAVNQRERSEPYDEALLTEFLSLVALFQDLNQHSLLRIIPPTDPIHHPDEWTTLAQAILDATGGQTLDPVAQSWLTLSRAYHQGDAATFAATVEQLHNQIAARLPAGAGTKSQIEYRVLNSLQPFMICAGLYVLIFLISLASWIGWTRTLEKTAFWMALVTWIIHTIALAVRIYISGRPPVTNLYSSAVFIGWGSILFGLLIDLYTKRGFGVLVGSVIGFLTLLIAHYISLSGDTMAMLVAVLDDNFWLATHVVVVTIGYVMVFLAGALGLFYIFYGLFTSKLDKNLGRTLANVTYGVVCCGLLFSFIGTILGGIWADQSWGRFWGWDPKENGALIIVIWTAIILHTRWGGFIRERGLMIMAVFGNIVTAWSWFGTNFLGVGLHSYGFHESGFFWLKMFILSQLAVMLLASIPVRYWRSHGSNSLTS
jgi:ABC-type transport system involved in cytochrome c biogenesis permease subunit